MSFIITYLRNSRTQRLRGSGSDEYFREAFGYGGHAITGLNPLDLDINKYNSFDFR